jgi:hypothetical protein
MQSAVATGVEAFINALHSLYLGGAAPKLADITPLKSLLQGIQFRAGGGPPQRYRNELGETNVNRPERKPMPSL